MHITVASFVGIFICLPVQIWAGEPLVKSAKDVQKEVIELPGGGTKTVYRYTYPVETNSKEVKWSKTYNESPGTQVGQSWSYSSSGGSASSSSSQTTGTEAVIAIKKKTHSTSSAAKTQQTVSKTATSTTSGSESKVKNAQGPRLKIPSNSGEEFQFSRDAKKEKFIAWTNTADDVDDDGYEEVVFAGGPGVVDHQGMFGYQITYINGMPHILVSGYQPMPLYVPGPSLGVHPVPLVHHTGYIKDGQKEKTRILTIELDVGETFEQWIRRKLSLANNAQVTTRNDGTITITVGGVVVWTGKRGQILEMDEYGRTHKREGVVVTQPEPGKMTEEVKIVIGDKDFEQYIRRSLHLTNDARFITSQDGSVTVMLHGVILLTGRKGDTVVVKTDGTVEVISPPAESITVPEPTVTVPILVKKEKEIRNLSEENLTREVPPQHVKCYFPRETWPKNLPDQAPTTGWQITDSSRKIGEAGFEEWIRRQYQGKTRLKTSFDGRISVWVNGKVMVSGRRGNTIVFGSDGIARNVDEPGIAPVVTTQPSTTTVATRKPTITRPTKTIRKPTTTTTTTTRPTTTTITVAPTQPTSKVRNPEPDTITIGDWNFEEWARRNMNLQNDARFETDYDGTVKIRVNGKIIFTGRRGEIVQVDENGKWRVIDVVPTVTAGPVRPGPRPDWHVDDEYGDYFRRLFQEIPSPDGSDREWWFKLEGRGSRLFDRLRSLHYNTFSDVLHKVGGLRTVENVSYSAWSRLNTLSQLNRMRMLRAFGRMPALEWLIEFGFEDIASIPEMRELLGDITLGELLAFFYFYRFDPMEELYRLRLYGQNTWDDFDRINRIRSRDRFQEQRFVDRLFSSKYLNNEVDPRWNVNIRGGSGKMDSSKSSDTLIGGKKGGTSLVIRGGTRTATNKIDTGGNTGTGSSTWSRTVSVSGGPSKNQSGGGSTKIETGSSGSSSYKQDSNINIEPE